MSFPILSTMILLPIAAAFLTIFLSASAARWTALGTTLALFSTYWVPVGTALYSITSDKVKMPLLSTTSV